MATITPTPQKLKQLIGNEALRSQILKELKSVHKLAKKKSSAAKAALSLLKERFRDVTRLFSREELADIGEEFRTLTHKEMKADEDLDAAAERVMVEEALKDQDKLAVLEEMAFLRRAGTVAVANVEDAVFLWSKNVHVPKLVMAPGSDPQEAEAVRNYCRSNNWNAMGNVV